HGERVADHAAAGWAAGGWVPGGWAAGGWAGVLPTHLLDDDPWLLLAAARQRYAAGQLDRAVDLYDRAERAFGQGAARTRCRRERQAVAVWEVGAPRAGSSAPRAGSSWYECLRDATRDRPLAHARRALTAGTGGTTARDGSAGRGGS